jgi:hypothetical protein
MSSPPDFDLKLVSGRSYAQNVKLALVCLVLGGAFLATARLMQWQDVPEARFLARVAEILGWTSLGALAAVLFAEWRWIGLYYELLYCKRGQDKVLPVLWSSLGIRAARIPIPDSISGVSPSRAEAIDKLYAELRPLMSRAAADPSLKEEVQVKLSHLRRLQSEEADEMEKRFEAGLLLKPGEGWQALKRADELLARYENPSSPDAPTERKN